MQYILNPIACIANKQAVIREYNMIFDAGDIQRLGWQEVPRSGSQPYEHFVHPTSAPRRARTRRHHHLHKMEEDRLATNLGPDFDEGMVEEPAPVSKQPKRRFVGRKTAEKSSEQPADPNANIEDSSAIQGVRCLSAVSI